MDYNQFPEQPEQQPQAAASAPQAPAQDAPEQPQAGGVGELERQPNFWAAAAHGAAAAGCSFHICSARAAAAADHAAASCGQLSAAAARCASASARTRCLSAAHAGAASYAGRLSAAGSQAEQRHGCCFNDIGHLLAGLLLVALCGADLQHHRPGSGHYWQKEAAGWHGIGRHHHFCHRPGHQCGDYS